MADLKWDYLRQRAMGMSADFMANPLRSTDLSPAELLMREAIQNSVDEKKEGSSDPVKFSVSRHDLRGDEKRHFVEQLHLHEIAERSKHFPKSHNWFMEAQPCLEKLDDPDTPFPIVTISDHNTNGLGGRWNRGENINSRFHNLVLSIGLSAKFEVGENLLGSYGIGKMVYALTSNIRTMAYYSVFDPNEESEGEYARFMATGFYPSHTTDDNQGWTGHAFLGQPSGDDAYPTKPITDQAATEFVESLGLEARAKGDTGLSVFLLDCPLDMEECRAACEKFWWPRVLDADAPDFVELEFFDNDKGLSRLRPARNPDLRPFIDCYRNLQDKHCPPGYETLNKVPKSGAKGGGLCLKTASGESMSDDLVNKVALVRRGLVIRYEGKYAREGAADAIGIFDTSEENMRAFTLSEPEAHDDWNANNDRLRLGLGDEAVRLINRTHETIKNAFRDFQIRLEDRKEAKITDDVSFLDEILGPIFDRKRKRPPPPPHLTRAISIHKTARHEERNGQLVQIIEVSLGLSESADLESTPCTVAIDIKPLTDANGVPKGNLPRVIYSSNGSLLADHGQRTVTVDIGKDYRVDLRAEAIAHPSWRARWVVVANAEHGVGV